MGQSENYVEEWKPIEGYENLYEVSNLGNIMSLRSGMLLKQCVGSHGYKSVSLSKNGIKPKVLVHRIVAKAFIIGYKEGLEVLHKDGNKLNVLSNNLRWGTSSENKFDTVKQGNHFMANKTHCINGHEYTKENTYRPPSGQRVCKICKRNHK